MTAFGQFTLAFFFIWMTIFIIKSWWTYQAGQFKRSAVRNLWPMTLGIGLGIFIYNYELEYWLQTQLEFLPFSVSSLRAVVSLMMVVFVYYNAIDKYTKFSVRKGMRPFLVCATILIIIVDVMFHHRYPYEQFQVWMTLLIIPPTLVASFFIADITKIILREEVKPLNRAHYYWWVLELIASSLSAMIFLGDAIYKVMQGSFEFYTPGVVIACIFYIILAIAAQARVVLPSRYTPHIFYFERLILYLRLRYIRFYLERKIQSQQIYNYERFWIPTYESLDIEIRRSFVRIMDTVYYLEKVDQTLYNQINAIRTAKKPYRQTLNEIVKVKRS